MRQDKVIGESYYRPQYGRPAPRRRTVKPETVWLNFVRKRLQYAFGPHCRFIKVMGGLGQEVGIADLIGVIRGRAVAIELKTPGGKHKLSPAQSDFLTSWTVAGGFSAVVDSVETLDAVLEYFKPAQGTLFGK